MNVRKKLLFMTDTRWPFQISETLWPINNCWLFCIVLARNLNQNIIIESVYLYIFITVSCNNILNYGEPLSHSVFYISVPLYKRKVSPIIIFIRNILQYLLQTNLLMGACPRRNPRQWDGRPTSTNNEQHHSVLPSFKHTTISYHNLDIPKHNTGLNTTKTTLVNCQHTNTFNPPFLLTQGFITSHNPSQNHSLHLPD